jgi:G3E family GTPase
MEDLAREFLRDTLELWHLQGTVDPGEPPLLATIALESGARVWIERAERGVPFRWNVRWREAGAAAGTASERSGRPCTSIAAVLNAMRLALGIDRGKALRVASRAPHIRRDAASSHTSETRAAGRARDVAPQSSPSAPIPVSVITGFLGSGKTTLLGRLLRHPAIGRTAVIINEFGEIGLDHELVEASTETLIALPNGCLCCKVRSDLTLTLLDLAARRAAGTVPAFERVVIETSGLADPAPILHALISDPDLAALYEFDRVVTTVDTIAGISTLDRHRESVNQIALAERIVLTKTDICEREPEAILRRISTINPRAHVVRAVRGEIDPSALFGGVVGQSSRDAMLLDAFAEGGGDVAHSHTDEITSASLVREQPISAVTLALFLAALAENCGPDLLRMKGIVCVAEARERPAIVHGVQHVYHAPAWLDDWPSDDRRTRMVFIARDFRPSWACRLLDVIEAEVHREARARTPARQTHYSST